MTKQNEPNTENNNKVEIPEKELPQVRQELSKVGANPKQSILILVVICLVFGYIFFHLFFSGKTTDIKETKAVKPTEISKPAQNAVSDVPAIPQLPDPPKLVDPGDSLPPPVSNIAIETKELKEPKVSEMIAPPTPLPQQSIPVVLQPTETFLASSNIVESEETKKRKLSKRKSSIVLISGVQSNKTPDQIEQEVDFKKRGNMEFILGRGKIIDAVLESGINTDFGGEVRAVIGRDVFSEGGKVILIPKGSRVFGNYSTSIAGAYGRISIDWIRIDLPNGYILNFAGRAVDGLGKSGTHGRVDNKYKERLSNAILMSAFNIGLANALDKVVSPPAKSQAATQNIQMANTMQSGAIAINNDTNLAPSAKITQICSTSLSAISDKTSTAFASIASACNNINNSSGATTDTDKLKVILQAVATAASGLLTNTAAAVTPTQAQDASKQAFRDVTSTVKDMVTQHEFKPTITIDQGTLIKIYVNKDYTFPKAAIGKSRLVQ